MTPGIRGLSPNQPGNFGKINTTLVVLDKVAKRYPKTSFQGYLSSTAFTIQLCQDGFTKTALSRQCFTETVFYQDSTLKTMRKLGVYVTVQKQSQDL